MSTCAACGHQPVAGPFCTNCGSATAPTTPPPTAPPPPATPSAPAPGSPPPATPSAPVPGSSPPAPRFPLYADEVEASEPPPARFPLYADDAPPATAQAPAFQQPAPPPPEPPSTRHRERHATWWLPWLLGVLFVALIATVGVILLAGGDDGPGSASDGSTTSGSADDGGSGSSSNLIGQADLTVPKPARASTDNQGNRTTYLAANLSDGEPATCWRTAGDATGKVLVFRFAEPVTITEVGMINGYAKSDPPNDWYAANRRVLEAKWSFDSGDPVTQTLEESRDLQTVAVDAVETRVVRLRLVQVSPPGGRNYTAISEISLRGE